MTERDPGKPQRLAADPNVSAWVGANAGSGKTRVLTERVARLLLAGADPGRILCLTYTKAAAAEMQGRLFALLGGWAMEPDADLGRKLGDLSGEKPVRSKARLADARRLFARALETPGGLKIQTIHAFCESLLRRFPLEAGIAHAFDVLDDRRAALMLADIRDRLAEAAEDGRDPAFDGLAERLNESDIDRMIRAVLAHRDGFRVDAEALIRLHFGDAGERSAEELARDRLAPVNAAMRRVAKVFSAGMKADRGTAEALSVALGSLKKDPLRAGEETIKAALTKDGHPRKNKPTKKLREDNPGIEARFLEVAEAAQSLRAAWNAHATAARTRDIHSFARAFLDAYDKEKSRQSLLDFDDLIGRTGDLLERSDMRAWVLYKLDRGIDHILVDEAQDTAPAQWRVFRAITDDFHAGESVRESPREGEDGFARSVFVVGDEKQSIYSFHGADPRTFDDMRRRYDERLTGIGDRLERPELTTSFRSASGLLDFVDAVFEGSAGEGMTGSGDPVRHAAHRAGDPARVDLWPLIEPEEKPAEPHWREPFVPQSQPPPVHPKRRLAKQLADEISRMISRERLPGRGGGASRPVTPGDILVLVRKRDDLARSLIRNLKARGVPVTGADRLTLAEELAVGDLLSLIKAVLNPADELSLAEVLRSPLCAVEEEDLIRLAHGRKGTLWAKLMASNSKARGTEKTMLADLAACAGFMAPFEFLERVLIRHGGRQRLIARLGPEAEDPIDEMLAQALEYENRRTPSLHGFIAWIEAGDIELKREMDKSAGEVRVMTVHGAKGLEAPIVILPDTTGRMGRPGGKLLPTAESENEELILWMPGESEDDEVTAAARAEAERRQKAEEKRLLYVGLTRAEDWLILAGAGQVKDPSECWYGMLETAFDRIGRDAKASLPEPGKIRRIADGAWPKPRKALVSRSGAASPPRPDWLGPATPEQRLQRIAPSQFGRGAGIRQVRDAGALDPETARRRGDAVHAVLERLPGAKPTQWPDLAIRLIEEADPGLPRELVEDAAEEALAVLGDPALDWVFAEGTLGEVAISIPVNAPGVRPMQGRIDRLSVQSDDIVIVDFKTDSHVPKRKRDVSQRYLGQLGAYRAALGRLYADRTVRAGLLWTRTRRFMELDPGRLDAAWAEALEGIDSRARAT